MSGFTKCPTCKRPIPGDSRRCPACGASLRKEHVRREDAGTPRERRGVLLAAGVVLAIGVAVAYFTGSLSPRSAPPPPPAPTAVPTANQNVKFGLPEAKRQEVFQEVLSAEDFVQVEADRRHPPLDPAASSEQWERHGQAREQFRRQATEENEKAIATRHGVTVDQLRAIVAEGAGRGWPRPARRSFR